MDNFPRDKDELKQGRQRFHRENPPVDAGQGDKSELDTLRAENARLQNQINSVVTLWNNRQATIEALAADNDRLRAALKPFAAEVDRYAIQNGGLGFHNWFHDEVVLGRRYAKYFYAAAEALKR